MRKRLNLDDCQWRLAKLWLIGAALLAVLLIVETMSGKLGASQEQAWKWLGAALLPIISLILSSLKKSADKSTVQTTIDARFYRLSFWTSVFYLLAVLAVPLAQPMSSTPPVDFLQNSTGWLAMIQSVVILPLGLYFVSSETQTADQGSGKPALTH